MNKYEEIPWGQGSNNNKDTEGSKTMKNTKETQEEITDITLVY